MRLSDISIKHPVFAWMLMTGLIVFGLIAFSKLGISQLPDVDFPVITVTVTWPGAAPDVMEAAVADVIEDAVMNVDGIQLVQSTSQEGSSSIQIQFNLNQDINAALEEVQTNVSEAQRNLPTNIYPPVITKTNPEDQPIMWIAVYNPNAPLRQLVLFVRDHLKDAMTTINGVGNVFLGGYVDPQMRVWLDNGKLNRRQITSEDVVSAINAEHILSPTGYQDKGPREHYVVVDSEFTNAKQCNDIFLPTRSGQINWKPVQIKDVGTCVEGTDNIRRISHFNGISPTVGVGIVKQHGTNAVAIADAARKKLEQLKPFLPKGVAMSVVADNTVFIRQSINELIFTLLAAVVLTSLVCYLFLGSWSSALNVILAMPVSLIGSFIFIYFLGFTLNSFTLLALSLSIGIVVDDAIMVLENIVRHFDQGVNRVEAALVGAREITTAATAASISILAIFVPVIFMKGIVGKFFFQFGVALSIAILLSLLEALTLAPMRCSQFLKHGENKVTKAVNRGMHWLAGRYRGVLALCLNWRWTVVIVAFAVFFASLLTVRGLRKEFLPPQDQSRFLATVYTPMGSSLEFTNAVFTRIESLLKSRPEVESYYDAVGGFGGGLVNQGIFIVNLKPPEKRSVTAPFKKRPSQQDFMQYMRQALTKVPGVERSAMLDLSLTGFSSQRGYPIEFEIQGPDWNTLTELSGEMRKKLAASKLMSDIDTDYNPNMPEIKLVPDRRKAARRGVTVAAISQTIATMVGGDILMTNKYTDAAGHRDDIQVQLMPEHNQSMADIRKIWLHNQEGEVVPLKDLVKFVPAKTLLTVTRYNRERAVGIFGNFTRGQSQSAVTAYIQKTAKEILPPGYHITFSGNSQAFTESFKSLFSALILGIFVAYMVLASQFNSFLHPLTILMALPFSMTGALWAMSLTDTSMNIYSLIGILLLMGIVKKNSILLVDFTNARRRAGLGVRDALLEACPIRLRPILMTSIATIAGAIPEAAAFGPGAEIIRPMAISVIGGVLFSTLLTLFVVPCAYSLFSRLEGHRHEKELHEALTRLGRIAPQGPVESVGHVPEPQPI